MGDWFLPSVDIIVDDCPQYHAVTSATEQKGILSFQSIRFFSEIRYDGSNAIDDDANDDIQERVRYIVIDMHFLSYYLHLINYTI